MVNAVGYDYRARRVRVGGKRSRGVRSSVMVHPRKIMIRVRRSWRRARRFVVHNVLHADDPPGRLALGAAIGMFITFTPTIGFQMGLVVFFAWLLRANKVIGLPIVWISNPATLVPIYWPCYRLGCLLLGAHSIDRAWWRELGSPPVGWQGRVGFYWTRFLEIAWPLWAGCIVVGFVLGYVTYYLVYFTVRNYRLRRWGQLIPPQYSTQSPPQGPRSPDALADDVHAPSSVA